MGRNNKHKRGARNKRGPVRSERRPSLTGRVQLHEHSAYVITENGDYKVMGRGKREIMDGDTVAVSIKNSPHGERRAVIESVVERAAISVVGTYQTAGPLGVIEPLDSRLKADFFILPEDTSADRLGVHPGDAVVARILTYPTRLESGTVTIERRIGGDDAPDLGVQYVMARYGYTDSYPEAALDEAEGLSLDVSAALKDPLRRDLRDRFVITIDPVDARDFDDAVYAEKRTGGGYRVVVAIADVSHYVRLDSPLNEEAEERGTSVYFPHFVLPMLPEALSNGLCSLNPHVDRLCMVCDLKLSRAGKVTGYEFYPAVMHSKARLTYNQVAAYFDGATDAIPQDKSVHKSLNTLFQLYQTLKQLRAKRHAMEFETIETYMTFDELGGIKEILPRTRNDAHKLIEECMLLANVAAAEYSLEHDIPMLYRVHEAPEFSRIQKVRDFVKLLGLPFPEQPTQADYQAVIEATKDRLDAPSIHAVLLRSMMQAYYGANNAGHYGLAYEAYTHFTSPIRRYPDLLLHRAIKAYLDKKAYPLSGAALDDAGEHFSQTERRADEASRSVTTWLKCHYMQQHLGDEFVGIISAVTEFGLFVTLKDLYVDGMIHVSQLGEDFFLYDQASQSLIGQNRGQSFSLGDEVKIQVAGVNLEERKIDFQLVQQLTHLGRTIRQKAPRTNTSNRASTTEEVFGKPQSTTAKVSEDGEKPVRKKKDKSKSSSNSYTKKTGKKSSAKSESKEKPKKKVKKKKSNAKTKSE